MEIKKEYSNNDITIVWKPKTCIHAAECVKRLPKVYNPKEKPWIKIENATTAELKKQIDACPSGALSYIDLKSNNQKLEENIIIDVMENGPLIIKGVIDINHKNKIEKTGKTTALCRCGFSENKPFCDGKHAKNNFKG